MKVLVASAYIFGIPALYIVLSEKRRGKFVGRHGAQALILWVYIFALFFAARFLGGLIYAPYLDKLELGAGALLWGYAAFRGYRALF